MGFALRPYKMSYREVKYFSFPGELLMRMLQMLVLPLLVSSLITVFTGIIVVLIIHPGKGSKAEFGKQQKIEQVSPADAFLDLIRNMFPPNLVQACTQQFKTKYGKRVVTVTMTVNETLFNSTNATQEVMEISREEAIPVPGQVNGVNALGLVVFSVYAPIGILFLIAGKIVEMDDLTQMGGQLGMYTITENNKIDKRITRFVLPVGATINMDGTALYEALAAIFIAQVNNVEMNFATAASIGAAGIPQAGLVTMVIVLTSVGLPTDDITLIIAVDCSCEYLCVTFTDMMNVLRRGDGNSVLEEKERKKPYKLISQDSDFENDKRAHSESNM
ncbi:hypothetical protein F7725_015071 [Dissostichus mawsoni]|uniref:Amino acid transporter n=1 Tax=Dissostichus mawsoni TaxID=36200 RepID=A0A7J5YGI0_DISMA|nr:hypothetical protein F7725_015071 [Dissostichus mawsoni]